MIRFSQNWNNKLDCSYFTTIRLSEFSYHLGTRHDVLLRGQKIGVAEVVKVEGPGNFSQIPESRLMTDTGYPKKESEKIFRNFYPNLEEKKFKIITFKMVERCK